MFALLSRKNGFVFDNQIWYYKALNQYSVAEKIRFRLLRDFKTILQKTQKQGETFWRVSKFAFFSQKHGFVFVNQIFHFKDLNKYSVAHKIPLRLLTDFKTNTQETEIQREIFWRVSRLASISQKNCFVFINQIWHFKALNQYSVA